MIYTRQFYKIEVHRFLKQGRNFWAAIWATHHANNVVRGLLIFLIASRLNCDIFDHPYYGHLHIEPYALYNKDPEQKIEFLGDASSQLGYAWYGDGLYGVSIGNWF